MLKDIRFYDPVTLDKMFQIQVLTIKYRPDFKEGCWRDVCALLEQEMDEVDLLSDEYKIYSRGLFWKHLSKLQECDSFAGTG